MAGGTPIQQRRWPITSVVRDEILREAGYMCGNPRCRHILTLELHHIVWVKDSGGNHPTNLIALCPNCHALHTQGHIPESAVRHWKGVLHSLNHAFSKEAMDLLLYLNQPGIEEVWYSGDGLLRFAGLIAAGLVHVAQSQFAVGVRYGGGPVSSPPTSPPTTAIRVALTTKGRNLVGAWLAGDEDRYRAALDDSSQARSNFTLRQAGARDARPGC